MCISAVLCNRPVDQVGKHIAVDVGGHGYDSWVVQAGHCRQWLATAATCCPRGDETSHLLRASA